MPKFINNKNTISSIQNTLLHLRNNNKNKYITTAHHHHRYQYNNFLSTSSSSKEKPKVVVVNEPNISLWTQFKYFPKGVLLLYNDFITYLNIYSASKTKNNAWSISKYNKNSNLPLFLQTSEAKVITIIPRRQKEQQRQFVRDIRRCLPIVGLYSAIPVIGNIFAFWAILHPYYLLSNQFYISFDQKRYYSTLDDRLNMKAFDAILGYLDIAFTSSMRNEIGSNINDNNNEVIIQSWMKHIISLQQQQHINNKNKSSYNYLTIIPSSHIIQLIQSTRILHLPSYIRQPILNYIIPNIWLRYRLSMYIDDTMNDNIQLFQDGQIEHLTNEEIVNATNVRSLPMNEHVSIEEMKINFKRYLSFFNDGCYYIDNNIDLPDGMSDEESIKEYKLNCLKLFTIYIPIMLHDNNYFK